MHARRGPVDYADLPETTVRVEAAAHRGKPVWFQVVFPWRTPSSGDTAPAGGAARAANLLGVALLLACIVGGLVIARRNIVLGRGDRRGASRLAFVIVVVYLAGYVFAGHHVLATSEMDLLIKATAWSLFAGGITWLLYLALEPHVRRRWPHTLISWSRLLAGRWQDPLVGRDVVIGSAVGVGLMLLTFGGSLARDWWTGAGGTPSLTLLSPLMGPGSLLGALCFHTFSATFGAVSLFFLLFLLRVVVRRDVLAATVFVILIVAQNALVSSSPVLDGAIAAVLGALLVALLFGSGIVAFGVAQFFLTVASTSPLTAAVGTWYGWATLATLLLLTAIAAYGFRVSLAGKPLLGAALEE